MKPVPQTRDGAPNGNCFAACVASILEKPIEEVDVDVASCRNMTELIAKVAQKANCKIYHLDHQAILDGVVKTSERYGILHLCTSTFNDDPNHPNSMKHFVVCEIRGDGNISIAFNPDQLDQRLSLADFRAINYLLLVKP